MAHARALQRHRARPPVDHLGFARLDTHRRLRRGVPEIVFGDGKTARQLIQIAQRMLKTGELVLITRLEPDRFQEIQRAVPRLRYDPVARLAFHPPSAPQRRRGLVLVATGGTADLPVAEEAALTLELLGSRCARLFDVGVAGVHRLLGEWALLRRARVIIVVAGM